MYWGPGWGPIGQLLESKLLIRGLDGGLLHKILIRRLHTRLGITSCDHSSHELHSSVRIVGPCSGWPWDSIKGVIVLSIQSPWEIHVLWVYHKSAPELASCQLPSMFWSHVLIAWTPALQKWVQSSSTKTPTESYVYQSHLVVLSTTMMLPALLAPSASTSY